MVTFALSCVEDDPDIASGECFSNYDCPLDKVCDLTTNTCVDKDDNSQTFPDSSDSGSDDDLGDTGNSGDTGDSGNTGNSGDSAGSDCTPGDTEKCNYQGTPQTEGIGPCKAGERTCLDSKEWGPCEGEVIPEYEIGELCEDGIDNDCDGKADNGQDFDGDGSPHCEDCCEREEDCPDPKSAWDETIHFCSHDDSENAQIYECDDTLTPGTYQQPLDYAKAIGLCKTATDDPSSGWGVISAEIMFPDEGCCVKPESNGILNALGTVIKPKAGGHMLALTSGNATNPFIQKNQGASSDPPSDWYVANGNSYPSSPACGAGEGTTGKANDPVMFKLRIRAPMAAKSFMFNLYFLSIEYPQWVCSEYNDFFVALLDSTHTSDDPDLQNPADKNLAMDDAGNPVGVNLAPAGLFKQCQNTSGSGWSVTSCQGTDELQGTGFQNNGGTGWLVTRGNVVPGEVITLRLAIWDLGDNAWDSMVLIDNFRWEFEEYKPGTDEK